MRERASSDPLFLAHGAHIGVADQGHVLDLLKSHDSGESPGFFPAPEDNAIVHLVAQFLLGTYKAPPSDPRG
jgi:hypothetical protein